MCPDAHDRRGRPRQETARDPTRVTSQPALRTSSGAIWIIVAAAFTAVCLVPLTAIAQTGGAAAVVSIVTGALLLAGLIGMVAVRTTGRGGPPRLRLLAGCFLGMALIALQGMVACVMIAWAPIPH